jgi:hypothetical protein
VSLVSSNIEDVNVIYFEIIVYNFKSGKLHSTLSEDMLKLHSK